MLVSVAGMVVVVDEDLIQTQTAECLTIYDKCENKLLYMYYTTTILHSLFNTSSLIRQTFHFRNSHQTVSVDWRGHVRGAGERRGWRRRHGMAVLESQHGVMVSKPSCKDWLRRGRGRGWS